MTSPILHIIIDTRESRSKIFDMLKESYTDNKNVCVSQKALELGDIQILYGETKVLIAERKTVSDLAASLKDSRYREQKARLIGTASDWLCTPVYIIEGFNNIWQMEKYKNLPINMLKGALANIMLRDNLHIVTTESTIEIVDKIKSWILCINKHYEKIKNRDKTDNKVSYGEALHVKKSKNMTNDLCFCNMLMTIKGLSYTKALAIQDKYNTMLSLCVAYSKIKSETDRDNLLKDIKVSGRKIGPKLSKRIHETLVGNS